MRSLIVNPAMCKGYTTTGMEIKCRAFAKIELSLDGKLSICGVIGPTRGGNCRGSAGQCVDEIRSGEPAEGWTQDMLQKFCDIWDKWHLNDMRPYCEHQKELGWDKLAAQKVTLYHYRLTDEASKKKKEAERAAIAALRKGESFTPTKEQQFAASLPHSLDIYEAPPEELAPYYHQKKPLYAGDSGAKEEKTRGWVRFSESPLGILCKPCPVCGYEYGAKWLKEEVPQDVIDWLFTLPKTTVQPAWI